MNIKHFKLYCQVLVSRSVVNRALKIAIIVGTALNFINQGELLVSFDIENLSVSKLFLTYLVPYSVTTYTAVSMKLEFQIGTKAVEDVDLKCKKCHKKIHLHQGEIIPECQPCGVRTQWNLA